MGQQRSTWHARAFCVSILYFCGQHLGWHADLETQHQSRIVLKRRQSFWSTFHESVCPHAADEVLMNYDLYHSSVDQVRTHAFRELNVVFLDSILLSTVLCDGDVSSSHFDQVDMAQLVTRSSIDSNCFHHKALSSPSWHFQLSTYLLSHHRTVRVR